MTFSTILYNLIIGPLELFFDVLFSIAYRITNNPGITIIVLSLAINFLVLPMYRRADALQAEERDIEARLQPWVKHIRKTFSGDERFMMLQTFYRQNNYKPTYALKGSMSLLLQIPFFIAAYHFLSNLTFIQGVSFGPIRDLSAPDALLSLNGFQINLLPLLMTGINLISAAIYLKGFPLKDKLQMVGMALIFLVLLYSSPSGLVFYWTLNNVFSLLKNIFYKLKKPRLVLSIISSCAGLVFLAASIADHSKSASGIIISILLAFALQAPILYHIVRNKVSFPKQSRSPSSTVFWLSCCFLTILTGWLIPSAVVNASPLEFVSITNYSSPLWYVLYAVLIAAGVFLVWFGVFYHLADQRGKYYLCLCVWLFSGIAIVDYMFFGSNYGTLSTSLTYSLNPEVSFHDAVLNIGILVLVSCVLYVMLRKSRRVSRTFIAAMCLASAGMAVANTAGIVRDLSGIGAYSAAEMSESPSLQLNRNGKNVVVLMMDRAFGGFVPFLLAEKPELQAQFEGFTFYPNCLSYGNFTVVGAPALYGGYEYTPDKLNERSSDSLVEKHDEALKVMPVLFDQNEFRVTVCDPPYAGYQHIPDLSIFDEYPDIHKYITIGRYNTVRTEEKEFIDAVRNRNFISYSFFRIAPLFAQPYLYNYGIYNRADIGVEYQNAQYTFPFVPETISKSNGMSEDFLDSYTVLTELSNITEYSDSAENTFLLLANDTAHEPVLLQEPEYIPSNKVDNTDYDAQHEVRSSIDGRSIRLEDMNSSVHYHVNMAALLELGKWFDDLRENGVYDNTRIIIVADHGRDLTPFLEDAYDKPLYEMTGWFNPMLMVKDFGSQVFSTDESFMTNADVPLLATADLISDPVNPFTGNRLENSAKEQAVHYVFFTDNWDIKTNTGNTFDAGSWYSTTDEMFEESSWSQVPAPAR